MVGDDAVVVLWAADPQTSTPILAREERGDAVRDR